MAYEEITHEEVCEALGVITILLSQIGQLLYYNLENGNLKDIGETNV